MHDVNGVDGGKRASGRKKKREDTYRVSASFRGTTVQSTCCVAEIQENSKF